MQTIVWPGNRRVCPCRFLPCFLAGRDHAVTLAAGRGVGGMTGVAHAGEA
ncbi:hypothetical protein LHGZ1_3019 [Laribacter hongkongensis]|uniref:Uncharacterized protein n=1 Tax=Laribacter hongkongensis TaxID=168471 RepID=A0A248LM31_9NEIS|nr:hypothetical protein LHGZ1_3019 [Laribacter hongkongensis]